jgi:hypothetical protein
MTSRRSQINNEDLPLVPATPGFFAADIAIEGTRWQPVTGAADEDGRSLHAQGDLDRPQASLLSEELITRSARVAAHIRTGTYAYNRTRQSSEAPQSRRCVVKLSAVDRVDRVHDEAGCFHGSAQACRSGAAVSAAWKPPSCQRAPASRRPSASQSMEQGARRARLAFE